MLSTPKMSHVPIPGYINLLDQGDFADMIKLWVLRWEDYSGGPIRGREEGVRVRKRNVMTGAEVRGAR